MQIHALIQRSQAGPNSESSQRNFYINSPKSCKTAKNHICITWIEKKEVNRPFKNFVIEKRRQFGKVKNLVFLIVGSILAERLSIPILYQIKSTFLRTEKKGLVKKSILSVPHRSTSNSVELQREKIFLLQVTF